MIEGMNLFFDRVCLRFVFLIAAVGCGSRSDEVADAGAGASGGAGGTSMSGGSGGASGAGTGGAGGAAGTGGSISGDSGSCGCVPAHVGWAMNGGHVAYHDASALEVCNLFVHQRTPVIADPPALFCEQSITDCAGAIGPGDVARALSDADVRAAIAAAPVLYGEDPRPYDGQVLRIEIGTSIIEVGVACRMAGCKPIPTGVSALGNLLLSLTKQELSRPPCRMTFPPP